MAKAKEITRNKANTAATKGTTNTVSNHINGKVRKVRVNIKSMKKSIKTTEEASKSTSVEYSDQAKSPKTRLCFVKLRRTLNNDTSSLNNNNNNNTLQAQCKVNKDNDKVNKNIEIDQDIEISTRGRKKLIQKVSQKMNNISNIEIKDSNVTTVDEMKKITTRTARQKKEFKDLTKSTLNKVKDNAAVSLTPRRCVIKLQKTPRKLKTNNIVKPTTPHNSKKTASPNENLPISTPTSTKKCLIKLQKTPNLTKRKNIAPNSTKECVIRLQRTPTTRENNEHSETVSSTNLSQLPIIDQNKRNNFRKLSLTRSSRKSSENKNTDISNNKQNATNLLNNINNSKETSITNQLKAQSGIKHLGKLSLRKPTRLNTRNVVNKSELTQLEPEQNSIICFEPARNSTLLEFGFTKDKPKENKNQSPQKEITTNDKSHFEDKSSSQNLANKSEEIVNILNSLDEDDEILLKSPERRNEIEDEVITNNENENTKENKSSPSKSHKFFNRSKEEREANKLQEKSPAKTQEVAKNRRFFTKRSTVGKRDNIYEFLSQSQTSDSDNATKSIDPTADIIKKLIEQGKVRVATNCKGKGKPVFKRKPVTKPVKKVKQPTDKKSKQLKKNNQKIKNQKQTVNKKDNNNEDEVIDGNNFVDDHYDNEDFLPDVDYDMENQRDSVINKKTNHSNNKNEQEGTFSRLARTVLINQTGRSDVRRRNPTLLLEMVRKYISTPKNKKMPSPQAALETDLSPIAMPPPRPAAKASPWRVNEDAYLPRTFNFSRSSGNLPSFSSDFIPATPRKEKSKNYVNILQESIIANNQSPTKSNQNSVSSIPMLQSPLNEVAENISPPKETTNSKEPSALSSFSSNDSNAENMPPSKPLGENSNENENIFDMKQLPNPRRVLSYRSPLKAINILEVVHLPPLTNLNKTPKSKETTEKAVEMFGFEENLGEDSFQTEQSIVSVNNSKQIATDENPKTRPKEDLFGFEDFLSQTGQSSQENEESTNIEITTNVQNQTIHDKLQHLRKFKPQENELELNLLGKTARHPLKPLPLFNDDGDSAQLDGMRQRGIKEMLCSTLINPQPSTSKEALRELNIRNLKNSNRPHFGEESDISELFKDPEPETTFNENDAHRTYIRPYKRKRRLKENKFVMFLDSDESGDENNSGEKRKHHHSHETDTSSEQHQAPKKKRHRKEPKENSELNEFVEEFNEMCKEVDSFELVVEKSS